MDCASKQPIVDQPEDGRIGWSVGLFGTLAGFQQEHGDAKQKAIGEPLPPEYNSFHLSEYEDDAPAK